MSTFKQAFFSARNALQCLSKRSHLALASVLLIVSACSAVDFGPKRPKALQSGGADAKEATGSTESIDTSAGQGTAPQTLGDVLSKELTPKDSVPSSGVASGSEGNTSDGTAVAFSSSEDLCRKLFGIPSGIACHFPVREVLGGSFQLSDFMPLSNPLTGEATCPAGYQAEQLAGVVAFNPLVPELSDFVRLSLCVSDTAEVEFKEDPTCPPGLSRFVENGQNLCSDIPRRVCESFEGVFDGEIGRCRISAAETVFGGYFETGEAGDPARGLVSILDPDVSPPSAKEELCETPNRFAGLETCSCPEGFDVFSSSSYAEPGIAAGFDRLNLCLRSGSEQAQASDLAAVDGCSSSGHESFKINSEQVCRGDVARVCAQMEGRYNTQSRRCLIPGAEVFGGSFQIGWSPHRGFGDLPPELRDPSLGDRPQFCESSNPMLPAEIRDSAAGCSCPDGFTALVLSHVEEGQEGDYDREYLCLAESQLQK